MFTVPIGARRRKMLDDFISANRERLGAAIGASDCHFGRHDIAQVVTDYEGDFRTAVVQRKTAPRQGPGKRQVPRDLFLRQQWSALVELPIRRLRHHL
jgi:hypothetical protein